MGTRKNRVIQVLVPIGEGNEEIETVCITDTLARFGANVVTASVTRDKMVKMSRGLEIITDILIEKAEEQKWDLIVCPGGMQGALSLKGSKVLIRMLRLQQGEKKLIGAICAAPAIVLPEADINVDGATCYPTKQLRDIIPNVSDQDIVVRNNIVTAAGPGITIIFALTLGKLLFGRQRAAQIAKEMLIYYDFPDDHIQDEHNQDEHDNKSNADGNITINMAVNDSIFFQIIWPKLQQQGFRMEKGKQSTDTYIFPPGVTPTDGKISKEFFDSVLRALLFLQSNIKYGHFFQLYSICIQVFEAAESNGTLPESFSAEWLEQQVVKTYPSFQSLFSIGLS